jgi:hypothetical protein
MSLKGGVAIVAAATAGSVWRPQSVPQRRRAQHLRPTATTPMSHPAIAHSARDGGVNEVAAQRSESHQDAILIRSREPALVDNVRDRDRCNFPGLG